jgi:excisionase family DNA binding protein
MTTPPLREPKVLSTRDVADLLRVTPDTVRRWAQQKLLTGFKTPGNQWRFFEGDVKELSHRYYRGELDGSGS